jgi:MFS family permease
VTPQTVTDQPATHAWFGIATAILLVAVVGIGLALSIPLLSIEMERMGVSGRAIGFNTAMAGLASLICVPFVPRLAARIGVGRLIALCIATAALSFLAFRAVLDFYAWFAIRFVFSAALGALFVLSEYWIASAAPAAKRGLVMGIYGTVLALGFAAGPSVLALVGTSGWAPYLVGAALYAAAGLPLFLGRAHLPRLDAAPSQSIGRYMVALPLATACGFAFGATETGAFSLLPVFGLRQGFAESQAALLVSAMAIGSVLSQIPLGLLSDRMSRGLLIMILALVGLLGALLIPVAAAYGFAPLVVLLIVWGGLTGGLYTVGLAFLAARFHGQELAGANAAFVMLYNIGLTVGPPIAGLGMDASPVWGMAIAFAVFFAVILLSGLTRGQRLG